VSTAPEETSILHHHSHCKTPALTTRTEVMAAIHCHTFVCLSLPSPPPLTLSTPIVVFFHFSSFTNLLLHSTTTPPHGPLWGRGGGGGKYQRVRDRGAYRPSENSNTYIHVNIHQTEMQRNHQGK